MHTDITMVATQERQGKEIILRTFIIKIVKHLKAI